MASPVRKNRDITRKLKAAFQAGLEKGDPINDFWFQPCVLLPNVTDQPQPVEDLGEKTEAKEHAKEIVCMPEAVSYFQHPREQKRSISNSDLEPLINFIGKYSGTPKQAYRDWLVVEELPRSSNRFTEYLVHHKKSKNIKARFKAYRISELEKTTALMQVRLLSNQLELATLLGGHQNLFTVRDVFLNEEEDEYAVVFDNLSYEKLSDLIDKMEFSLGQRILVALDILSAVTHLHENGVVHRNLIPRSILVQQNGHARLGGFEFAGCTGNRPSTVGDLLSLRPAQAETILQSTPENKLEEDLIQLGTLFSQLFNSVSKTEDASAIDSWLEKLKSGKNRFESAAQAKSEFEKITSRLSGC